MLIMLLVATPLTIIQSLTRQETKQHASGEPVILTASSIKSSYNIDEEFNTDIALQNPGQKDISAVDFTITYDSDILRLIEFNTEGAYFSPIAKDTQTSGNIHFVGVQMSTLNKTFPKAPVLLRIGSITFKVIKKTTDNIEISFKNSMITASEQPDAIVHAITPQTLSINADFKNPWETPTKPPASSSSPSESSFQGCWIYGYSDSSCEKQIAGYPTGCIENNLSEIGICRPSSDPANYSSEKVGYCSGCSKSSSEAQPQTPVITSPPTATPTPLPPTATPTPSYDQACFERCMDDGNLTSKVCQDNCR